MRLVTEQQARRLIRQYVRKSSESRLAVAFWGDGACEKLDLRGKEGSVSIVCNLRMGGTNPHEIEEMRRLGIAVTQCDALHAKVYLFDDAVLIGSSNASSNGLSFQDGEGPSWIEANVFSDDPDMVKSVSSWMGRLPTRPIDPEDLEVAKVQWGRRRLAIGGLGRENGSVIQTLRKSPTAFDGQETYACFYTTPMDHEGEQALKDAQEEFGEGTDGFQDWPDLPKPAMLVCFWVGARGGLRVDGCYRRQESPPDRVLKNSTLQLMWEVNDRPDLKVTPADLRDWRQIYAGVRASDLWDKVESCAFVDFSEVARRFMPD